MIANRRQILTALASLGFGASVARAAETGFDLRLTNEGLVMPVVVRGRRLQGILDCGASASLMDTQVAQSLGLKVARERKGAAVYRTIRVGQSEPVHITAGDAAYTAPVMIMPIREAGLKTDMLIGRDILNHFKLDLDGPRRHATFRATRQPLPDMTPLKVTRSPKNTLVVDMEVEGIPVRASVDTGSSTPLILKGDWALRHDLLHNRKRSQWLGGDVSGLHTITMSSVRDATIGGLTFRDIPVEVSDNLLEFDVNLGLDVFLRLRSFWDMDKSHIWLSGSAADLAQPFARERSGLAYLPEGEGLNVIFVAPQSPAATGGWRKGDIITAIDGMPVPQLAAIDDWKRDPARQSARLTLAGGETRVLRLSDYY